MENLEKELLGDDPLDLGSIRLHSRLIVGTGKYDSFETMRACHHESGTQMVTIALRRIPLAQKDRKGIIDYINLDKINLLPNTAGAHTAEEALRLAHIAISMGLKHLKIEVMGDSKSLLADPIETVRTVQLIRKHYSVEQLFLMVYTNDDPIVALRLYESGANAVMPAGSPIGSGRGIQNPNNIQMILDFLSGKVPIILDAGIGSARDAVFAMEMGLDGILMNTAIAQAQDPVSMAKAMRLAWISGRYSYRGGRIPRKLYATASSPGWEF